MLIKKKNLEENGWTTLAEKNLKEIWNNKKDDKVWKKYLKNVN